MRTLVAETIIYEYNELSEAAKEKVREDNNRDAWDTGWIQENIYQCAKDMFDAIGLDMTDLTYDLHSRGGEPRFSVSGTIGEDFNIRTFKDGRVRVFDYWVGDNPDAQPEEGAIFIRALMDSMSAAIYEMAEAEDEDVGSDEYAHELAAANDYEYDEEGNLI